MKQTKILILVILVLTSLNALADGNIYNVVNGSVEYQNNFSGSVKEVALEVIPDQTSHPDYILIWDLGTIKPGTEIVPNETRVDDDFTKMEDYLSFRIKGALGYNVKVYLENEKEKDKLHIDARYKIGASGYIIPSIVGNKQTYETNYLLNPPSNAFYVKAKVVKMWAEPGAPAGVRTFEFTIQCEYYDLQP